jgi:hypothetical protein
MALSETASLRGTVDIMGSVCVLVTAGGSGRYVLDTGDGGLSPAEWPIIPLDRPRTDRWQEQSPLLVIRLLAVVAIAGGGILALRRTGAGYSPCSPQSRWRPRLPGFSCCRPASSSAKPT